MSKFKINDRVSFYNNDFDRWENGYIVVNFAHDGEPYLYMVECDYRNPSLYYHGMRRGCRFFNINERRIRKIDE